MRCTKTCRIRGSTVELLVTVQEISLCYITQEHRSACLLLCCTQMNIILYLIAYCAITNRFTDAFLEPSPCTVFGFHLHDSKVTARFLKEF